MPLIMDAYVIQSCRLARFPESSVVAKAAAWVLLVAAVIGSIWFGINWIYSNGYTDGSNEVTLSWNEDSAKIKKEAAEALRLAETEKDAEAKRQKTELLGTLGNEKKRLAELEKRERAAVAANAGLWVTVKGLTEFGGDGKTGENSSACVGSSPSGRVRLSEQDEQNIRADYGLADRVAIQYETCRKTLIPLVEVVEDTKLEGIKY